MLYYSLRILTAWLVLFHPAYQSWKSLSHRPVSDAELERWVKHWTVIGLVIAFEYTFEYFISWVPFWYEIKTLFLLFLSLPQTQGAIYLYDVQLQPFFSRNEDAIDAGIASARSNILTFVQAQVATILKAVYGGFVNAQNQAATNAQAQGKPAPNVAVAIPSQLAANLWQGIGGMLAGSIAQANATPAGAAAAPAQAPAQAPVAPQQVPLPPTPAAQ